MRTDDFDYHLPEALIAQTPIEPRHSSRLLVLRRDVPELEHSFFFNLAAYLRPGDVVVINHTKVIPARIYARKSTGGQIEFLLLNRLDPTTWETLIGGKLALGQKVTLEGGLTAEITEMMEGSRRRVRFSQPLEPFLDKIGQMPLPPYIHEPLRDPNRYQTVYASCPGSAAAPTAGLHFTPELMRRLASMSVRFVQVTLHVGLDTFAPVNEEDPTTHQIHTEWCEVTAQAAEAINLARQAGGRIIAVGTTSVRTLETAAWNARSGQVISAFSGPTNLFILPGFQFRVVDMMITNFHLPRSTLLMLVSAYAGRERVLAAYQEAIQLKYRFFSFGDAMLIM